MRLLLAELFAPLMFLSGFRFSRKYHVGVTRYHRVVRACVDTKGANERADMVPLTVENEK